MPGLWFLSHPVTDLSIVAFRVHEPVPAQNSEPLMMQMLIGLSKFIILLSNFVPVLSKHLAN
jgi:hypothetical protein